MVTLSFDLEIGLEYADHLYNAKKTRDLKKPEEWLQMKFFKPKRPKTGTEKNKQKKEDTGVGTSGKQTRRYFKLNQK